MIEYPSIINSSKAPRERCIAFNKLDGSNFRAKWTNKKGFYLYGSRTQLIDGSTPILGEGVFYFQIYLKEKLHQFIKNNFRNERQIIVFGEFFGPKSFAGMHDTNEPHKVVVFDILIGHKHPFFIKPKDFIQEVGKYVEIPEIIYDGKLTNYFIERVRNNEFNLNEGVVCKGFSTNGVYRGKTWMCKIKTFNYLERIKKHFSNWKDYWE